MRGPDAERDRVPPNFFFPKRSYRERRLIDALKLLPALGVVLFLLPILWTTVPTTTGAAMGFLFLVWLLLIVGAGLLSRALSRLQRENAPDDTDDVS